MAFNKTFFGPGPSESSLGTPRFGYPYHHPVIDAFNQGMLPSMMDNNNYTSDFGHGLSPGAPSFFDTLLLGML